MISAGLEELDLSGNLLCELPPVLSSATMLRFLHTHNNPLVLSPWSLASTLGRMPQLIHVRRGPYLEVAEDEGGAFVVLAYLACQLAHVKFEIQPDTPHVYLSSMEIHDVAVELDHGSKPAPKQATAGTTSLPS
jgi:hypothetical protein